MSAESASASASPRWLAPQYETAAQQYEAAKLGTWLFVAQAILFFGAVFAAYGVFRVGHPEAFGAGSLQLNKWVGGASLIVALAAAWMGALAVRSAQLGKRDEVARWLGVALLLGVAFLVLVGVDVGACASRGLLPGAHWSPRHLVGLAAPVPYMSTFFGVYFAMIGLHALYVLGGIGWLAWVLVRANKGDFSKDYWNPVEMAGLHWAFVCAVWVFAYPLLYLV